MKKYVYLQNVECHMNMNEDILSYNNSIYADIDGYHHT